jgi:molecular chaperone GrpE (heat shock protein)
MQKGYVIGGRLLRPALVVVTAPRDAARQSD